MCVLLFEVGIERIKIKKEIRCLWCVCVGLFSSVCLCVCVCVLERIRRLPSTAVIHKLFDDLLKLLLLKKVGLLSVLQIIFVCFFFMVRITFKLFMSVGECCVLCVC